MVLPLCEVIGSVSITQRFLRMTTLAPVQLWPEDPIWLSVMLTVPLKDWICAYPASELDHELGHRPIGCELSPIMAIFALNPQFEQVVCQTFPPPEAQPVSAVNPLTSGEFPDP